MADEGDDPPAESQEQLEAVEEPTEDVEQPTEEVATEQNVDENEQVEPEQAVNEDNVEADALQEVDEERPKVDYGAEQIDAGERSADEINEREQVHADVDLEDEVVEEELYDEKGSAEIQESKTKGALGSIISLRKTGGESGYYDRRVARFGNTYKLYPDNPFHVEKVEKLLREVLLEAMENMQYDADNCMKQSKWACSMIRAKVKEMEFDRYKIITLVTFGEKRAQDLMYGIRFLWDAERDRLAISKHENMHVFGIAMCIGIYYE